MIGLARIAPIVLLLGALPGTAAATEILRNGVYCDPERYEAALAAGTVLRGGPSPFSNMRLMIDGTVRVAHSCALPIPPHRAFWRDYAAYYGCDAESDAARLIDAYIDHVVGRADEGGAMLRREPGYCRAIARCAPVTTFNPETFEADFACWSATATGRPDPAGADSPPPTLLSPDE